MTVGVGLVGGGWISRYHLEALERLGRTELVGVVAGRRTTSDAVATRWGGRAYDDVDAMLAAERPDAVWVAVPPHRSVAIGERLVAARVPFLIEKPLAAADADGPARLAEAIAAAGLVVGVGYHLRALDIMAEVRRRLASARRRWSSPAGWTRRPGRRGGAGWTKAAARSIEQATHLYDLARWLVGEAVVVGAASTRDPAASPPTVDVADSSAAVLRFANGAIGSFANTRRLATAVIEVELISDGLLTTIDQAPGARPGRLARLVR